MVSCASLTHPTRGLVQDRAMTGDRSGWWVAGVESASAASPQCTALDLGASPFGRRPTTLNMKISGTDACLT